MSDPVYSSPEKGKKNRLKIGERLVKRVQK